MKKVIFLVTTLNSGGIENYLLRFLRHYEGDFIPIIVCKNGIQGELYNKYREVKNIQFYDGRLTYINIFLFYRFYKFILKNNPDSICDFTGNFAGIPLLLAKLAGIKHRIAFYRGSTDHFYGGRVKNKFNSIMNYLVLKNATSILANSNLALDYFFGYRNIADDRLEVVYNGINASDFLNNKNNLRITLNIPKDKFVVAHVGRLDVAKNHTTIIEVAKKLVELSEDYVIILCGKNVDLEFKDIIRENQNLEGRIKLLGYTKDVIEVLNTANCFYFPSITEGQPNALIEALVRGLPFVASNIKPISDIIPKEYHDQLIDPLNIELAVEKIQKIKESQKLRDNLNLSKWAIDNFDADRLFSQFKDKLSIKDK